MTLENHRPTRIPATPSRRDPHDKRPHPGGTRWRQAHTARESNSLSRATQPLSTNPGRRWVGPLRQPVNQAYLSSAAPGGCQYRNNSIPPRQQMSTPRARFCWLAGTAPFAWCLWDGTPAGQCRAGVQARGARRAGRRTTKLALTGARPGRRTAAMAANAKPRRAAGAGRTAQTALAHSSA